MSRFPGLQFPNYFGVSPNGGRPFTPPRQPQRLPFPYHHGRPQMQRYPPPSQFRPASPGPHINNYHYRPQFVPRGEQRNRSQVRHKILKYQLNGRHFFSKGFPTSTVARL